MSSATSINGGASCPAPKVTTDVSAEKDSFRPWHFFVLVSLLGATAAVVMARRPSPEHLVLLSFTIAAAGVCAAALYGTLVPLVRKEASQGRVPLSDRARAAIEREKMLVLRSIKELEFDRAMGKMSAADFEEMAGRLRARAIALMKQLDESIPAYRDAIERELAARVAQDFPASRVTPKPAALRRDAGRTCSCGTSNDADAAFCKRCGTRLPFDSPEHDARSGHHERGKEQPSRMMRPERGNE